MFIWTYTYISIYEDETLIRLDQQAGGQNKQNWTGGGMRARPIRAGPIRAQGGPIRARSRALPITAGP